MSQIAATIGLTVQNIENNVDHAGDIFDALREKALEVGASTKYTAAEAAEGLNILVMSGFDAYEAMGMVEDVLHLAAAGSMDMASSAGYVSGAMKGFSDGTKDAAYYADLMAKGATLANTNVAEMGEALSDSSASARSYSQNAEATTLALLRLAEQQVVGSAASTALAAAMKDLYTPTDQALKVMDALGVSAYEFGSGAARDVNDVVNDLNVALSGYSDNQRNAYLNTIFGIQGLDAYNKMVVTSVEKQEEWAAALAASSGEATRQYDTMTDNLLGDIDKWNSALDGFKIALSDQLTPAIRQFVQFGADAISTLTAAFKEGGFTGAIDAFGSILSNGLVMVIETAPKLVEAGIKLTGALGEGLLNNLQSVTGAATEIVLMLINEFMDGIPGMIDMAIEIVAAIGQGIAGALPELIPKAIEIISTIYKSLTGSEAAGKILESAISIIQMLVNSLVENIPYILDAAAEIIGGLLEGITSALPLLAEGAIAIITSLADYIRENLPAMIESALELLTSFTGSLRENVGLIVDAAIDLILALVQGLADALPALIEYVPEIVSNIANIINDNAPKIIAAAFQIIVTLAKGLIEAIPTLVQNIPKIISAIVDVITAFNWINLGSTIVKGLISGITSLLGNVGTTARTIVQNFTTVISDLPGYLKAIGADIVRGLINGIKAGFTWIIESAVALVELIVGTIKNLLGIHSPSTVFAELGGFLIEGLLQGIANAWKAIVEFFSAVIGALIDFLFGAWETIKNAASAAWEAIAGVFKAAWEGIKAVWDTVVDFFSGIWEGISSVFSGVADWFGGIFSSAFEAIASAWSGITGFFSGVWEGIKGAFGSVAGWFGSTFSAAWQAVKNVFSAGGKVFDGIKEGILNSLKSVINAIIGGINKVIAIPFNGINAALDKVRGISILGFKPFSWVGSIAVPQIPLLANGAVIGPNNPFLAILGDQQRGTNIETPESLLRDIYREENGSIVVVLTEILKVLRENGTGKMPGGDTYNFYSPEALDPVSAAREMRKAKQQMALSYL